MKICNILKAATKLHSHPSNFKTPHLSTVHTSADLGVMPVSPQWDLPTNHYNIVFSGGIQCLLVKIPESSLYSGFAILKFCANSLILCVLTFTHFSLEFRADLSSVMYGSRNSSSQHPRLSGTAFQ